ncbi:hypothetical protein O181_088379 [Austropuccinia psidii MF-1]|uniref:Uncharacterized protein n=1 Tax=Austropuccinia psidii MF-1 TaxID=1389203 RepID=A0A9Q3IRK7_9BASI|nr:hypothetical protein [Austropuccinia psidii MF-1]
MANVTPDSQLSAYECFQRQIHTNQEEDDENTSCPASLNIENERGTELHNGPSSIQPLFEESPSQGSSQKRKRRTSEEARLHQQQLEHERILKRQRRENDRVNAEAQRLKQIERRVAQENQEHNRKTRFFWNEESTRQLLDMMRELRMDFHNMDGTTAGFIPWARFFKTHENRKTNFTLLKNLSFETLE